VFSERCHELKDFDKIEKMLEKAETRTKRRSILRNGLQERISELRAPYHQLQIPTFSNQKHQRGTKFTTENDRFIILALNKYGIDNPDSYAQMKRDVMKSKEFQFDWWMKSRSIDELKRRGTHLLSLMERDIVAEYEQLETENKRKQEALMQMAERKKGKEAAMKQEARGKTLVVSIPKLDDRVLISRSLNLHGSQSLICTSTTVSSSANSTPVPKSAAGGSQTKGRRRARRSTKN
jgi:hypothetical protein